MLTHEKRDGGMGFFSLDLWKPELVTLGSMYSYFKWADPFRMELILPYFKLPFLGRIIFEVADLIVWVKGTRMMYSHMHMHIVKVFIWPDVLYI